MFARLSLICTVLALTAGPVLAAPVSLHAGGPTLSAPSAPASPVASILKFVGSGLAIFGITIKKDIGTIAGKFVQRAQNAQGDYKTGVSNAGSKWEQNAGAAEAAWESGVQNAASNKHFVKGVSGKGAKYQANAANVGPQRYAQGVANAQAAYQAGMAPVLSALQGVNLPPRSFRGSPANQARSNAVATALAALRANK
jgi:hypothetical protein